MFIAQVPNTFPKLRRSVTNQYFAPTERVYVFSPLL